MMPPSDCLSCGRTLDACTSMNEKDAEPEPGSISICLRCGHIMAFAADLRLRELNDEEARYVAGNPEILAIQRARLKVSEDQ